MKILIALILTLFSLDLFAGNIKKTSSVSEDRSALIGIYVNGSYTSQVDISHLQSLNEQLNSSDSYVSMGGLVLRLDEIKTLGFRSKAALIDFLQKTISSGRDLAMFCSRDETGNIDVCEYDVIRRSQFPISGRTPVIRSMH